MRAATSLRDQRERRAGGIRQRSRHLFECRRQRRFDRFYTDPDEVVRVAYAANVGKLAAGLGLGLRLVLALLPPTTAESALKSSKHSR